MNGQSGLSSVEAAARLYRDGPNLLESKARRGLLYAYAQRLRNPLVLMLALAGAILAVTGDTPGFFIIVGILLLSLTLDVVQEHRAGDAAAQLKEKVSLTATVIRDSRRQDVPAAALVEGDVILLAAGDLAPADGLLVEARDLYVNEAMLTGESFPAEKQVPADCRPAEPCNCLFMGSSVVSGSATVRLTATGRRTRLGAIAQDLGRPAPPTAFEAEISAFSRLIVRLTLVLVLSTLLINLLFHRPPLQSFLFAVALAVGLTPELLPMIVSLSLAHGALRLSRRGVIVKRLSDIHDLGAMDILCSDKTGTLTEACISLERQVGLSGAESREVLELAAVNAAFETGLKSPLDEAILAAAPQGGQDWTKLDEVPFDFERRRVSVLAEKEGRRQIIVKGAPEDILALCQRQASANGAVPLEDEGRAQARQLLSQLGSEGLRTLAVAWREMPSDRHLAALTDEHDLVLAGFLAFRDPPKADARAALAALTDLGVAVKIFTGDGPEVTRHVCRDLGLNPDTLLCGSDLAAMNDEALAARLGGIHIFCRVSPAQKLRLLSALRRQGHVVGYIGDGINDAPALHEADVGFSVDSGVDVAREAAGMILLRKDLSILAEGVREGRRTHANILKYVMMAASSNFGNMLSMAVGAFLLPFLPMLPVQILLNNLLYDISEIGIPMDRVDAAALERPQRWNLDAIRHFMFLLGPASSLFDFLTFYILLHLWRADERMFHTAWFVESMATQILVIFIIRSATPWRSRPHPLLLATALCALAAALLLPVTMIGRAIGFVPLPFPLMLTLTAITLAYLACVFLLRRLAMRHHVLE